MVHKIYITGSIDDESFKAFSEQLDEVENKPKGSVVEIIMNSHGGCAMDALAFYGRIIRSKVNVNITAYGWVASAAVLILAACDHKRMANECWLMVHEDEDILKGARTSQFEKHAKHMRRLEDQWSTLLEWQTGTHKDIWLKLHKDSTYLTADECKTYGIVDEVI